MRGYFAIGIEGASKAGNVGNLIRTAHAFGAAFVFLIDHAVPRRARKVDTARSATAMPLYEYETLAVLALPKNCKLVGIELTDEGVDLPSFPHPLQAAYLLGGERRSLRPETLEKCDHVVKIPTRFSLNVATAGAIVMYDRLRNLGRFAERPTNPRGRAAEPARHVHGGPVARTKKDERKV